MEKYPTIAAGLLYEKISGFTTVKQKRREHPRDLREYHHSTPLIVIYSPIPTTIR